MIGGKLLSASAAVQPTMIEDVFSTYLYTGNSSTQTITNGIDLAGEGGLVWIKSRNNTTVHYLQDTERGANNVLTTTSTAAQSTLAINFSFTDSGFSQTNSNASFNQAYNYASWTFRQAPRFFDVVTYTGTGANRTIAHDLGVVPGCIIVKRTDTTGDWQVYHRSNANTEYMVLNSTAAKATGATRWNSTTPTSSVFSLGTDATVNASGSTYVAYLFAHDPLGPSGDGSDGLIACGSYTGTGAAGNFQNLGWEPQYVLVKGASTAGYNWIIHDVMRGMSESQSYTLKAESSGAENLDTPGRLLPRPTGFEFSSSGLGANNASGVTYIYIAIRRGPMREPTVGTEVFAVDRGDGTTTNPQFVSGFAVDLGLWRAIGAGNNWETASRITGQYYLRTNTIDSQLGPDADIDWDFMTGFYGPVRNTNFYSWMFRRAPGFFDVVAYRGTGSTGTKNHNLGVVPEMMILKNRNDTDGWFVYHQATGNTGYTGLNTTNGFLPDPLAFNNTSPTASVFTVGSSLNFSSSFNYIAYLFATLPGTSKVGSYTGNGSSQTINCAFTTGARFVLIKRTDTTGDWYVWDTARGIVAGNDPRLSLNTSAAEVTTDDTIDPASSGFIVNQVAATNVNVNAATYIYLAIA